MLLRSRGGAEEGKEGDLLQPGLRQEGLLVVNGPSSCHNVLWPVPIPALSSKYCALWFRRDKPWDGMAGNDDDNGH